MVAKSPTVQIHIFEVAGLGKGPFQVMGCVSLPSPSLGEQNPEAYMNAMRAIPPGIGVGTCAYCGHALVNNYIIKSADEHRFVVGSECVMKAGDHMLTTELKMIQKKERQEKARLRQDELMKERVKKAEERKVLAEAAERKLYQGFTKDQVAASTQRAKAEIMKELSFRLEDGKLGFRDSVADDMKRGLVPRGRGRDIVIDILSKQVGRSNSKAYAAEALEVEKVLEAAETPMSLDSIIKGLKAQEENHNETRKAI
jgi:hypothetical protein